MSDTLPPVLLFEHPGFTDVYDALRQSRLHGFIYRADHHNYRAFCEAVERRLPAGAISEGLTRPLAAVPDNTALYMLFLTPSGRDTLLPTLIREALALGFNVFDDLLGRCHTPTGVWTIDGFSPDPQTPAG
jgi:hypothetical protein